MQYICITLACNPTTYPFFCTPMSYISFATYPASFGLSTMPFIYPLLTLFQTALYSYLILTAVFLHLLYILWFYVLLPQHSISIVCKLLTSLSVHVQISDLCQNRPVIHRYIQNMKQSPCNKSLKIKKNPGIGKIKYYHISTGQ